ncbi:MAG: 4Fe-4S dicluster domain-containing protein [Nitrospira sp.]|nr:4Fe-4S dicluster domain-containing protein [bacterium]MBL7050242.1 4Fe-4S dicluster domain-containing protein [Nitrospira sp.]
MSVDRRKFLKIAGLASLGLALNPSDFILMSPAEASSGKSLPSSGERLGMTIDVRKFKNDADYQRIIDACHSIHNVPTLIPEKNDIKNEVKWIWTDTYGHTFPEQINEYHPQDIKSKKFPLLCNHCDHPPCVRVCPTKATFKSKNGIVSQDPHRCIGCRFCMAACPYGSRSFNWVDPRPYIAKRDPSFPTRTMGVVEKCTFCVERLAKGLQPACVEVSKGAMVFGNLADAHSKLRRVLSTHYTLRRKPAVGTMPSVFYVIGGQDYAG